MSPAAAETIALQALGWLAADDELWPAFLGASGSSAEDARAHAQDPAYLASVLDFVTSRDDWVMAFCDGAGLGYEMPLAARHSLPGAERVEWT